MRTDIVVQWAKMWGFHLLYSHSRRRDHRECLFCGLSLGGLRQNWMIPVESITQSHVLFFSLWNKVDILKRPTTEIVWPSFTSELSGECFYPRLSSFLGVLTFITLMTNAHVQSESGLSSVCVVVFRKQVAGNFEVCRFCHQIEKGGDTDMISVL